MFCWPCISVQSLWITNLTNICFSCMFISILYVFRAAMCPTSGKWIVSIRHLVYVTLCGWPLDVQVWMRLVRPGWGGGILPPQYTPTSVYSRLSILPPQYIPTSHRPNQYTPTSVNSHLSILPPQYTPTSSRPNQYTLTSVYSHLSILPPQYTPTSVYSHLTPAEPVSSKPAHQTVIHTEWHIPDVVLIQLILLMMDTWLPETCRE